MKFSDTALGVPVIVGRGRVGQSMASAALSGGLPVELRGREEGHGDLDGRVVLLCVPDSEIQPLAASVGTSAKPSLIGHCSGATRLEALAAAGAEGTFSLHPLQTVPDGETSLAGCPAAVAGSDPVALTAATRLAEMMAMRAFEVAEEDRAIYHAAASIASNFLVTIEQTAADLLGGIAIERPREVLEPLVRRSLDNWVDRGSEALTGPIVRGDDVTVEAHREALLASQPDLVDFYDSLAARTRQIAAERSPG